jgi:hypothetical protein
MEPGREVKHACRKETNALESVRTKKVVEWCKKTLGKTVSAKRKEAFASRQKTEQKQDQFKVAV